MDTTDPEIVFDERGVCNHCRRYDALVAQLPSGPLAEAHLASLVARIQRAGRGKDYDCVVGLSGGVDSSYVAYTATRLGLRPLAIHLDNGWDSELAVQNIQNVVSRLGLDLYTHVVDWEEFRDLQLSFLRASVVDIELITDHAITALVYRVALRQGVRFMLSGNNVATEAIMPFAWCHRKSDLRNLRAIQRRFGSVEINTLPTASTIRLRYWEYLRRLEPVYILNYVAYDRQQAKKTLQEELGWRDYGGKHYESFFTRFYQTFILPEKFGIDKRKAHLSALIGAGQISREDALKELTKPLYDPQAMSADKVYVLKKLGLSEDEFDALMRAAPRSHLDYPSEDGYVMPLMKVKRVATRMLGGNPVP